MNSTQLAIIRTVGTFIIAGLSALFAYYPSFLWIPAVISAGAAVGFNAVPSIGQPTVIVQSPIKPQASTKPPFTGD